MKFRLLLLLIIASFTVKISNAQYDSTLARKLGADERGMKKYVLAILKTGSNDVKDTALRDSLFHGHFENIGRLAKEGKLAVAGPISKNEMNYRGIFILNVSTIEEAKALLQGDPTVSANVFDVEYFNWYGSAALPEYLKVHEKIEKKKLE